MFSDLSKIFILAGAIQGIVLSIFLLRRKENKEANIYLSLLFFLIGARMGFFFIENYYFPAPYSQFLRFIIRSIPFLYPPLFYFYVQKVIQHRFPSLFLQSIHFLPFILYIVIVIGVFKSDISFFRNFEFVLNAFGRDLIKGALTTFYLVISYRAIIKFIQKTKIASLNIQKSKLIWLKQTILVILVIILLQFCISFIIEFSSPELLRISNPFVLQYFALTIFMFWVTYKAISIPYLFQPPDKKLFKEALGEEKYKNSSLSESTAADVISKLRNYIETGNKYLDPDFKLADVATALSIPRQHISQALSEHSGVNFNTLLNGYRVNEAKRRLADPSNKVYTIGAIAFDSGFNSIATFNRVFKEVTGISPNDFRKNHEISVIKSDE